MSSPKTFASTSQIASRFAATPSSPVTHAERRHIAPARHAAPTPARVRAPITQAPGTLAQAELESAHAQFDLHFAGVSAAVRRIQDITAAEMRRLAERATEVQEGTAAARASIEDAMAAVRDRNPEQLRTLEGELRRKDSEICTLQREVKQKDQALRLATESGAPRRFYARMGNLIQEDAGDIENVIDQVEQLIAGGNPDSPVLRRLMGTLRTMCDTLNSFADNAAAYGADPDGSVARA